MEQVNHLETDQCLHCGCALEGSPVQRYSSFCSDGCKVVYHNIHDLGLEDYYQHCKARGYHPPRPSIPQTQDFEYFNRRSFQKGVVERHGSVHSATIFLEGTEGPATAWLIEKLPSALSGMFTSSINIATGVARFSYYPEKIKLSQILQTVNELGFVPRKPHTRSALAAENDHDTFLLKRIFSTGTASVFIIMLTSLMQSGISVIFVPLAILCALINIFLTLYCIPVIFSDSYFRDRAQAILRNPFPFVGLCGLLFWNLGQVLRGSPEKAYFDLYAVILFLLCILNWSIQRMLVRAFRQVRLSLMSFSPLVRVRQEDFLREAPIEAVRTGQEIVVGAGEYIPADGVVSDGSSLVDTSRWDGIRQLSLIRPGSSVIAGTLNVKASITVKVQSIGETTKISRVVTQLELPNQEATSIRNAQILYYTFAVCVLLLFVYLALSPNHRGNSEYLLWTLLAASSFQTSSLPVLSIVIGLGKAAREGIFFRDSRALDSLAAVKSLYLDKSTTLSAQAPFVLHAEYRCSTDEISRARQIVLSMIESTPHHPLSVALRRWIGLSGLTESQIPFSSQCYILPGRGFMVEEGGNRWSLGSLQWLTDAGLINQDFLKNLRRTAFRDDTSYILLTKDQEVVIAFETITIPDKNIKVSLKTLRAWGRRAIKCLSSDDATATELFIRKLDVPFQEVSGGLYREELLRRLKKDKAGTAFVGDGRYERDKMECVDLGVTVTYGVKSLLDQCGLFLQNGNLSSLCEAFSIARSTVSRMWRTTILGCAFHGIAGIAAFLGWIGPLGASLMMVIGSYAVFCITIANVASRKGLFRSDDYLFFKSSASFPDSWTSNNISEPPINEPLM